MTPRPWCRSLSILTAALLASGCTEAGSAPTEEERRAPPPAGGTPHLIGLTPVKPRIEAGTTVRLSAVALDASRKPMYGARIDWVSSQPDVAAVDSTGLVTAFSPGYAMVTAYSGAAAAHASVHVLRNGAYPDIVVLTAPVDVMSTCEQRTLSAATMPDVAAPLFRWRSSDTDVLDIDAAGVARGITAGSATITVMWAPDTTRRTSRTVQVIAC